jgi:hypothetical protein
MKNAGQNTPSCALNSTLEHSTHLSLIRELTLDFGFNYCVRNRMDPVRNFLPQLTGLQRFT